VTPMISVLVAFPDLTAECPVALSAHHITPCSRLCKTVRHYHCHPLPTFLAGETTCDLHGTTVLLLNWPRILEMLGVS
jgi:hypothetical protein